MQRENAFSRKVEMNLFDTCESSSPMQSARFARVLAPAVLYLQKNVSKRTAPQGRHHLGCGYLVNLVGCWRTDPIAW